MRHSLIVASFGIVFVADVVAAAPPPAWSFQGPRDGGILAVAADPDNAARLVVAGQYSLAVSDDRGQTWRERPSPCTVSRLQVNAGSVYATCGGNVMRSQDFGDSWVPYTPVDGYSFTYSELAFRRGNPDAAVTLHHPFHGSSTRRYTAAAGKAWSMVSLGEGSYYDVPLVLHPHQANAALGIVSSHGSSMPTYTMTLHKFSPLGQPSLAVGQVAAPPVESYGCSYPQLAIDAGNALWAFAGCQVRVSVDDGVTWRDTAVIENVSKPLGGFQQLRTHPTHAGDVAILGREAIARTTNGGASWTRTAIPGGGWDLSLGADGTAWVVTGERSLRSVRDGVLSAPLPVAFPGRVKDVELGADARYRLAKPESGGATALLRSSDAGATWQDASVPGRAVASLYPSSHGPSTFFAATYDPAEPSTSSGVHVTRDGGVTWQDTGAVLRDAQGRGISYLRFAGPQPGIVYGFTTRWSEGSPSALLRDGPVRSRDGGKTWSSIAAGLAGDPIDLLVAPSDPQALYLPVGTGYYLSASGLYRSANGGDSWERVAVEGYVRVPRSIDAGNPQWLYAVHQETVLVSEDGGARWRETPKLDLRLKYAPVVAVAVRADPQQSGTAYAVGTDGTTFRTRDRGGSWHQLTLPRQFTQEGVEHTARLGVAPGGARYLAAGSFGLRIDGDPVVVDAGIWWNPAESGWGLNVVQHASGQLFVVWYTYDAAGKPLWQVVPGGTWLGPHTFEGALYQTKASSYFEGAFDPQTVASRRVGTVRLDFSGNERATFRYTRTEGSSGTREIERQRLPATKPSFAVSHADLWWNHLESGAGLGVAHAGERMFLTWYAYDAQGDPTWLVAPDVASSMQVDTLGGELYATTGPPDGTPFDPARVVARRVGTVRVVTQASGAFNPPDAIRVLVNDNPYEPVTQDRWFTRQPF